MPEELDPERMKEIENSDDTWIIDFWASWCGPCQKMAPEYEEASEEVSDVEFGKVNMEEHSDLATQYNVSALPTLVILKGGEIVGQHEGYMGSDEIVEWVKKKA